MGWMGCLLVCGRLCGIVLVFLVVGWFFVVNVWGGWENGMMVLMVCWSNSSDFCLLLGDVGVGLK